MVKNSRRIALVRFNVAFLAGVTLLAGCQTSSSANPRNWNIFAKQQRATVPDAPPGYTSRAGRADPFLPAVPDAPVDTQAVAGRTKPH